jgi:hypothetical protein
MVLAQMTSLLLYCVRHADGAYRLLTPWIEGNSGHHDKPFLRLRAMPPQKGRLHCFIIRPRCSTCPDGCGISTNRLCHPSSIGMT